MMGAVVVGGGGGGCFGAEIMASTRSKGATVVSMVEEEELEHVTKEMAAAWRALKGEGDKRGQVRSGQVDPGHHFWPDDYTTVCQGRRN